MKSNAYTVSLWSVLILALTVFAPQTEARISVSASVERSSMSLGETNHYTLTIRNVSTSPDISPPQADGLQFRPNRQLHTSTQIINNRLTSELRLSWPFQASRTGTYEIPGRTITIDGEEFTLNSVSVRVTEMSEEIRNRFFMRWELEPGPWFVGQSIQASLKLYVRPDISARRSGQLTSSVEGIVQPNLEVQGRQYRELVDGTNYIVIAWDTLVIPVRAGEVSINTQLPLVYETGRVQRDFWGARPIQEEIILSTPEANWVVRELPRASRPSGFSGAIGDFEVNSRLSSDEVRQGDPVTLTLQVRGRGNLDRIDAPPFPESSAWRAYPPRTDVSYNEGSRIEGMVEIEYILTPRQAGELEIPELEFSWFEPRAQEFHRHTVPTKSVMVSAGQSTASTRGRTGELTTEDLQIAEGLRPLATQPGNHRDLRVIWNQPVFWAAQSGTALALAIVAGAMQRRRRLDRDPLERARRAALQHSNKFAAASIEAAKREDAHAFYGNACLCLGHRLAAFAPEQVRPESLSLDQLEQLRDNPDIPDKWIDEARLLFERKDSLMFAGLKPDAETMKEDLERMQSLNRGISEKKS